MFIKNNKGQITFFALVIMIIISVAITYAINLFDTNEKGVEMKEIINRSTKSAALQLDKNKLSDGYYKISNEDSEKAFQYLLKGELNYDINLSKINDNFYYFKDSNYEIYYFVFNATNNDEKGSSSDLLNFKVKIKGIINAVTQLPEDLKARVLLDLIGENSVTSRNYYKVVDTRSINLGIIKYKTHTFSDILNPNGLSQYRFASTRLNTKAQNNN